MTSSVKVVLSAKDEFEVRHRAERSGMTVSEYCRNLVKKDLLGAAAEMPDAIVDKVERGKGGRAVAAYLSPPLSGAISRLARQSGRSASWTMRDLIRCELRRRGLLPTPNATAPQDDDAQAVPA